MQQKLKEYLVNKGYERFNKSGKQHITDEKGINIDLINDLEEYPHAFVIGCLMDRQMKNTQLTPWRIPGRINHLLGSFEWKELINKSEEFWIELFNNNNLHRFNNIMAKNLYKLLKKIEKDYGGIASKIWSDKPNSSTLVSRFLEFEGFGLKLATMATNILVRDFKIIVTDYCSIDISTDVHVMRVFERTGLVNKGASMDKVIYKARSMNPEYPGIIDLECYEIGSTYCKKTNPKCDICSINKYCEKHLE